MSFAAFGMSAIGLVWAVVQLAMVNSDSSEEVYRNFLGKASCCHFALVRNIILSNMVSTANISFLRVSLILNSQNTHLV